LASKKNKLHQKNFLPNQKQLFVVLARISLRLIEKQREGLCPFGESKTQESTPAQAIPDQLNLLINLGSLQNNKYMLLCKPKEESTGGSNVNRRQDQAGPKEDEHESGCPGPTGSGE
jgi:hypothetical protein